MKFILVETIDEDIWTKKRNTYKRWDGKEVTSEWDEYTPTNDSKYKRLIKKPINTLTVDEIKYVYAIATARYMAQAHQYDSVEEIISVIEEDHSDEEFQKCYDFLHGLSFPLTIYRAIRKDEIDSNGNLNISGKGRSVSWTTDTNLYKKSNSIFRNENTIVQAEIDSDIIDSSYTIQNFMHYSLGNNYGRLEEKEITLKSNFKQSDLKDLHLIDKNLIERMFIERGE